MLFNNNGLSAYQPTHLRYLRSRTTLLQRAMGSCCSRRYVRLHETREHESSPEIPSAGELFREHFPDLVTAVVQLGVSPIATELYAKEMINELTFGLVTNVPSVLTDRERATKLLQNFEIVVKQNSSKLGEFISVLEARGKPRPPVVDTLRGRFGE